MVRSPMSIGVLPVGSVVELVDVATRPTSESLFEKKAETGVVALR